MAQDTTKNIRDRYLQAKKLSGMDIMSGNPSTKYQREGAKNNAIAQLPNLEGQLLSSILENSVTVSVTEDVTDNGKLLELVSGNENVILLGFKDVDRYVTTKLFPNQKESYPFNAETVSRLNNVLAGDVTDYIEALSMPTVQPTALLYGVSNNIADVTSKVTRALRDTYGSELNIVYLSKKVQKTAMDKMSSDKLILIITEVPLDLTGQVGGMTGRSTVITTKNLPGSIKFDESMTADDLKASIAKSVKNSNKKRQ